LAFIGGNDDLGLGVVDALGEAVGRESREHHRMNGTDPRAGQDGVGDFRNHRQVDGDAIAFLDIACAQDVGHPAYLVVQFLVGDVSGLRGIVAFPDDRGLVGALGQVAIDTIEGGVEDAVLVILDRDGARREREVFEFRRLLHPVQALGLFAPESVRVGERAGIHVLVLGFVNPGALGRFGRHIVDLLGHFSPSHARDQCTRNTVFKKNLFDYASA